MPLAGVRERGGGFDRPNPGERKETGEQEEVKAHLMVCLDGSGMVGARWSTASREVAA